MAHKKGGGSTKNGRDSIGKRLGLKITNNNFVRRGQIILRQRGLTKKPGLNVFIARDFSLFASQEGFLRYNANDSIDIIRYL